MNIMNKLKKPPSLHFVYTFFMRFLNKTQTTEKNYSLHTGIVHS